MIKTMENDGELFGINIWSNNTKTLPSKLSE